MIPCHNKLYDAISEEARIMGIHPYDLLIQYSAWVDNRTWIRFDNDRLKTLFMLKYSDII